MTRGPSVAMPDRSASDVTILISSFDQVAFLAEAIESALAQTVPCRIIVIDDGSTDGSPELAEQAGVATVRLPHRGALETFRSAVELVETPYYCLLNGDDAFEPTYIERTRPAMEDPRIGFVYTGVRYVGAAEGEVRARPFDPKAFRWSNLAHGASLVRRSAYESVGGYDRRFSDHHEDWALWVAMVAARWIGVPIDEPLLRYRRHVSGSRNSTRDRDFEQARWRLARRHPRFYGPLGLLRLTGGTLRRVVSPT